MGGPRAPRADAVRSRAIRAAGRAARTNPPGGSPGRSGRLQVVTDTIDDVDILKVDPEAERRQVERLVTHKSSRDQEAVDARLAELSQVAALDEEDGNLLPPMKESLRAGASIG